MRINTVPLTLMLSVALLLLPCGCQASADNPSTENTLTVVTTTTMLYDLVSIIGGDQVTTTALMGAGIDPHLYQASAGDVAKLEEADVVVYNGLHLEGAMGDVFDQLEAQSKAVICIGDGIDESQLLVAAGGSYDPHIWFSTPLWMEAASYLTEQLSQLDPTNAQQYQDNCQAYLTELEELEQYILDAIQDVDPQQRVLITAHDAFGYFGQTYGFEVLGIQGISTQTEASTADVSDLATLIAQRQIKAIFLESSLSSKSVEALQAAVQAQGFQVSIGGQLYSDSLGDESSGHDSYIATVKANIDTITSALK